MAIPLSGRTEVIYTLVPLANVGKALGGYRIVLFVSLATYKSPILYRCSYRITGSVSAFTSPIGPFLFYALYALYALTYSFTLRY
jgi:hypothetical protein